MWLKNSCAVSVGSDDTILAIKDSYLTSRACTGQCYELRYAEAHKLGYFVKGGVMWLCDRELHGYTVHQWHQNLIFQPMYTIFFFTPMPPPVRTNFLVFPPGCDDSIADFWSWGAHEARLRCPNDVIGDMYMKMRYQDGPLSLNLLTTQTMVTMGIFPYQKKFPW